MNFKHLLENHKFPLQLFKEINKWLSRAGIYLKEGAIDDAAIIEAGSSTKNKAKARDPKMHLIQKGKQWFFGLKAHIGADARTGLTHRLSTMAANVYDLKETANFFTEKSVLSQRILATVVCKKEELK